MYLARAAIEGSIAGAVLEFAGEFMAADAIARGQIGEGGLPADGIGAAGEEIPPGAPEGHGDSGGDGRQDCGEEA
jgi:hypothetical protein